MSPIKEPTFFGAADILSSPERTLTLRHAVHNRGPLSRYLSGLHPRGPLVLEWDDYLKLFHNVRDEIAIGEASVSYLWQPSAAEAIRARVPGARLIFILRDPAERLFSHYVGISWLQPRETFREWFLTARNAGGLSGRMVAVGRYATHMQRFLERFPRDQICVYLYDDYRGDPRAALRHLFAFLGVDPHSPVDLSRRENEAAVPRFPALHALRTRLIGARPLAPWLPEGLRRTLLKLYQRAPTVVLDPADRAMINAYYRDEILRAADLIGRDLSAWLS